MRIVVFSRFPRFDKLHWKPQLLRELDLLGCKPLAIIYDSTSMKEQILEGIKRYGLSGCLSRFIKISRKEPRLGTQPAPIKLESAAKDMGISVYYVSNHNNEKCVRLLQELKPDLVLFCGPRIIKKSILSIPRIGVLNNHYAILPKIRGMDVAEYSILLGEQTGVTVHLVVPEIDQGDILHIEEFEVVQGDTLETIRRKCQDASVKCYIAAIKSIKQGTIHPKKQKPENGAQYFAMNRVFKELVILKLKGKNTT